MGYISIGSADIGQREIRAVLKVLRSGIISPAKKTQDFERLLAKALVRKHAVLCNSGQSALEIALLTIKEIYGIKTVACPTLTYISTLAAIMNVGLEPYFIDVNPSTYNIDWDHVIEQQDNFDAVLPVSLFGLSSYPTNNSLDDLGNKPIIVDNCESMFASNGEYGDISCGSFYASHSLSLGNGGVITTDINKYMSVARSYINHGLSDYNYLEFDALSFERNIYKFTFNRWGRSYKVNDIISAIGIVQLSRWPEFFEQRQANARFYCKELKKYVKSDKIQLPIFTNNVFMMFPIVMIEEGSKSIQRFLANRNIETRPMMPLTNQPIFKKTFGDIAKNYPVSDYINSHGFYVGCHTKLTESDLQTVTTAISDYLDAKGV